jgi:hypothetical protein
MIVMPLWVTVEIGGSATVGFERGSRARCGSFAGKCKRLVLHAVRSAAKNSTAHIKWL